MTSKSKREINDGFSLVSVNVRINRQHIGIKTTGATVDDIVQREEP